MKICSGVNFVWQNTRKRGEEDKGTSLGKHPRKDEERVGHFHTNPLSILMEIKVNLMSKRPKPIKTLAKFINKNKYWEYHTDFRHTTTSECCKLKKSLHELAEQRQLNGFLMRGKREKCNCHDPKGKKDNGVDHDIDIIVTIIRGIHDKKLNVGYQKTKI